ncbi:BglG family transcription antiterminator [Aerococcus kribbianus]|uniref:PTS sugar transporter subunit IIA n=1 Tax=Aerococcus kribbianus TaxID=2999064 RepID=A0A9X3FSJ2_9LACT|nr:MULTISPECIES: PTS sugar transporter subunit IIA [unclassified Aerococcus]MCZ0717602.1 PTS sugar transporter subunit IIA [Aerococcus sp. YH-aer221]MCZ0725890.1 PTS sugar transporter subunit IIA [Aerococcus sp. YH-aer222]
MALINRWYKILSILEKKHQVSQNELENYLGTSRITVKNNIKMLNNELEDTARIDLIDAYYQLTILDYVAYSSILSGQLRKESDFNSSSKRKAYIIKKLAEIDESITIADLTEKLNVSRGTVNKDINSLRKQLKDYGIDLIGTTNKGIQLSGEEYQIRLLYINYVLEYFDFSFIDLDFIKIIDPTFTDINISDEVKHIFLKAVETTLVRKDNGLSKNSNLYTNYIQNDLNFDSILTTVEQYFQINLNAYEREFLSYPFNIYNQGDYLNKKYESHFIPVLFDDIITAIQREFAIDINQEKLFEDINIHLHYLVNRLVTHTPLDDILFDKLSSKYPLSYELSQLAITVIENKLGEKSYPAEKNYLAIYIEMAMNLNESAQKKKIAVVCHTGRGTAKIIERRFAQVLGSEVEIVSLAIHEISQEKLNHFFAVFSTVPLRYPDLNIPVVQINTLFEDSQIRKEWEKIERLEFIESETLEVSQSVLTSEDNYYKYLVKMASDLQEKNFVDNEFCFRIIERERLKSTIFENGIAMPHAINHKSDRVVLNIGYLENNYSNEKIEIIFMIGIPENNTKQIENTLIELYDFIFLVAQDHNLRKQIKKAKSKQDILNIVRRK